MAYPRDANRSLASIETVLSIRPGDDTTETVITSRGPVTVRAGSQIQPGQIVIYIRAGTALPLSDARYAHLAAAGTTQIHGRPYHVLRWAIVRPVSDFIDDITAWQQESGDLQGQHTDRPALDVLTGQVG